MQELDERPKHNSDFGRPPSHLSTPSKQLRILGIPDRQVIDDQWMPYVQLRIPFP